MKNINCFYVNDAEDVAEMIELIRKKIANNQNVAMIRYTSKGALDKTLDIMQSHAIYYGLNTHKVKFFVSSGQALSEILENQGYKIVSYYGSTRHSFTKGVSAEEKKVDETIRYRKAILCKHCESVMSEKIETISIKKADEVTAREFESANENTEISRTAGFLNIIDLGGYCRSC